MSHFVNVKTQIKDGNALIEALKRLGFTENEIEVNVKNPIDLKDYMGGLQNKKANVVVRQDALRKKFNYPTNDIGFLCRTDGQFEAIMDDGYLKHQPKFMTQLTQFYGVEKAKAELRKRKIGFVEDMTDKNCPRLRVKL